jgi:hypothetical protein
MLEITFFAAQMVRRLFNFRCGWRWFGVKSHVPKGKQFSTLFRHFLKFQCMPNDDKTLTTKKIAQKIAENAQPVANSSTTTEKL